MANSKDLQTSIDMTVFRSDSRDYHVETEEETFVINVCGPLVNYTSVPEASAVCRFEGHDFQNHKCVVS